MRSFRKVCSTALGLVLAASATLPAIAPARAGDLESLRAQAQLVADEVTTLERRLDGLRGDAAKLERRIERTTASLAAAELEASAATQALGEAEDVYVTRAVATYKRTESFGLDLMLSANTLSDLYSAVQVTNEIAEDDAAAVEGLQSAMAEADASESALGDRRARLVTAQAEMEAIADETDAALRTRRQRLGALTREIAKLEAQARRAAEQAARQATTTKVPPSFLDLLSPSGPSPGIPDGFASTGVSFEGVASWYGPGFEGNLTASGDVFDSSLFTAASLELPLGTWLYVEHEGQGVVVLVNDRGPYIDGRILDLSKGAAEAIGIFGLGWIRAEILVKG